MPSQNTSFLPHLQGWRRRIVFFGAVLAALAVILMIVGALLPERTTTIRQILVKSPRHVVWDILMRPQDAPRRLPYIKSVTVTMAMSDKLMWSEEWLNGATVAWESTAVTPEVSLAARFAVADASLDGTRRWELADDPAGTRLVVTDHLDAGQPLVRLLVRFLGAGRLTDEYLKSFQAPPPSPSP